jgi:hypothetical protein
MATAINSVALHWADILVLVAYFAIVIGFGIWVSSIKINLILFVNGYFSHHVKIVVVLVGLESFCEV